MSVVAGRDAIAITVGPIKGKDRKVTMAVFWAPQTCGHMATAHWQRKTAAKVMKYGGDPFHGKQMPFKEAGKIKCGIAAGSVMQKPAPFLKGQ